MKPLLEVERLQAGYGSAQVLFDVTLSVGTGEVVALLGRNGMGKTTTIGTIMGLVPARGGMTRFEGRPLLGAPPYLIAQAGIGLVPEPSLEHFGLAPVKPGSGLREAAAELPTDSLYLVAHRALRDVPRVHVVWELLRSELGQAPSPTQT